MAYPTNFQRHRFQILQEIVKVLFPQDIQIADQVMLIQEDQFVVYEIFINYIKTFNKRKASKIIYDSLLSNQIKQTNMDESIKKYLNLENPKIILDINFVRGLLKKIIFFLISFVNIQCPKKKPINIQIQSNINQVFKPEINNKQEEDSRKRKQFLKIITKRRIKIKIKNQKVIEICQIKKDIITIILKLSFFNMNQIKSLLKNLIYVKAVDNNVYPSMDILSLHQAIEIAMNKIAYWNDSYDLITILYILQILLKRKAQSIKV